MRFEMVVFTAVFALLGASVLLQPRTRVALAPVRPPRGRNQVRDADLGQLLRPALLFRNSVAVAHC
jgi:hypothetical protein